MKAVVKLGVLGWIISGLTFAAIALQAPVVQAAPEPINLSFSNFFPPHFRQNTIIPEFIAEFEKRTNGKVKVKYYPAGSLLTGPGMINGVLQGMTDIGLSHVEYTPGRMPATEACNLPLGYPSGWVANKVVNDFYGKFKPKEWDNVRVLWMHASSPSLVVSKKQVNKLEDLKGLQIRAPGTVGDIIKALGGTPRPTPAVEMYDALSRGVLEGAFLPFESIFQNKLQEVTKYITSSWEIGSTYTFYTVMSKKSYDKLPADVKKALDDLSAEYADKFAVMWNSLEFPAKEGLIKQGMTVTELSPQEAARWKEAVAPVIDAYVKRMAGSGHSEADVKSWIKFLRDRIDYWTAKQIELKIKSVTGPAGMR
jgi:TRAP-type transport system periplasmic protein